METGRSELLLSHENLFLFLVMIIVVIFMGMLWSYTKKQKKSGLNASDSEEGLSVNSRYKSLSASFTH